MDTKALSGRSLQELHSTIYKRLVEEDSQSAREKVHGVREFRDWRALADELEAELQERGLPFQRIPW